MPGHSTPLASCSMTAQHGTQRRPEDSHLLEQTRVPDVVQIHLRLLAGGLDSGSVAKRHLRQATNAGTDDMPCPILGNDAQIALRMQEVVWARADQAHLAPQHVDDLRQLIQSALAQEGPERRDPMRFDGVVGPTLHLGRNHGPKLDGAEGTTVLAHARLAEEQGATVPDWIEQQEPETDGHDDRKQQKGDHEVEGSLSAPEQG